MCMKNVNATMFVCSDITVDENQTNSLIGVYDSISLNKINGEYCINNFNIALNCSIIFDEQFEGKEDCVQVDSTYEFMIRLSNVDSEQGIVLHRFLMSFDKETLKDVGKKYFEFKRFLLLPKIVLPQGVGDYVLKLFIRNDQEEIWNTQTIHGLMIKD